MHAHNFFFLCHIFSTGLTQCEAFCKMQSKFSLAEKAICTSPIRDNRLSHLGNIMHSTSSQSFNLKLNINASENARLPILAVPLSQTPFVLCLFPCKIRTFKQHQNIKGQLFLTTQLPNWT